MTIDEIPPAGAPTFSVGGPPFSVGAPPSSVGDGRPDEAYDIRVARDGTWFYHGTPIGRMPLVKLFSTVLRRDDAGGYWLVTPAERGRIRVDDAPFVAVELAVQGLGEDQILSFRTNLDDWVTADADHPIIVRGGDLSDEPAPYILVRDRLDARIGRAVFYELVGLAIERPTAQGIELGVWSKRVFFPLGTIPSS